MQTKRASSFFVAVTKENKVKLSLQEVNKSLLLLSCVGHSLFFSASASYPSLLLPSLLLAASTVNVHLHLVEPVAVFLPRKPLTEKRIMMMGGGGSRYPFTLSQWQELELQALVFRYMASGIPVPSDLVLCIRRRLFIDPQTLPFLPNPPAIGWGWGAYQMGGARKAMDAEPGRCRRTDGKKWRCSKEAYPDSKYCERHMHRGKSRSRKPVELSLATSPVSSHCSSNFSPSDHFPFSCSSSARPPAEGYSRHKDSTNLSLDSLPLSTDNYRSPHEYPFLLESSRGGRTMPCRAQIWRNMQSTDSLSRILVSEEEMEKQYFLSGTDRRADSPAKLEEKQPRPFHCFLDEKPPKNEDPWMSMNMDSKTQLSISLPMANHGMPMIASQCYNDG